MNVHPARASVTPSVAKGLCESQFTEAAFGLRGSSSFSSWTEDFSSWLKCPITDQILLLAEQTAENHNVSAHQAGNLLFPSEN